MSDRIPVESNNKPIQPSNNEEIDLVQLLNAIGRLFEKLFNFIGSIFKGLFKLLILALKPVVKNIKLLGLVALITIVIGFAAEKYKTPVYYSEMLVQPHFESKYKLSNNINYFNALISSKKIDELSKIFEVDSAQAASLVDFELTIGPETANTLLQQYDAYIKTIDSSLAAQVSFEDYLENRDILSGEIFAVKARSTDNNIFTKLETGFTKTFENPYSKKLKKLRDSTIQIKKEAYSKELNRLDSLQRVYFDLIKVETENNSFTIGQQGTFPLQLERTPTKEYDLFQEELRVRRLIRELDEKMIEESVFYDVIASFEEEGTLEREFIKNYIFLFPVGSLILLGLISILISVFNFIKRYDT
jgi:hypothetical protein